MSHSGETGGKNPFTRLNVDFCTALHILDDDRQWPVRVLTCSGRFRRFYKLAKWINSIAKPTLKYVYHQNHFLVFGMVFPFHFLAYRIDPDVEGGIIVTTAKQFPAVYLAASLAMLLPIMLVAGPIASLPIMLSRQKARYFSDLNLNCFCHYLRSASRRTPQDRQG